MFVRIPFLLLPWVFLSISCAQNPEYKLIGGPCEGCEAVFEYEGMISSKGTLAIGEPGERLIVSGTIYKKDEMTPASGVILYIYHTDANGIYPPSDDQSGWAKRHGRLRTWMKTGPDGRYSFSTIRPASYPNTTIQQHIHATLLEPDGSYYYIQDFLFDDDPNLAERSRNLENPRGGDGHIMKLRKDNKTWVGSRNITLRKGL